MHQSRTMPRIALPLVLLLVLASGCGSELGKLLSRDQPEAETLKALAAYPVEKLAAAVDDRYPGGSSPVTMARHRDFLLVLRAWAAKPGTLDAVLALLARAGSDGCLSPDFRRAAYAVGEKQGPAIFALLKKCDFSAPDARTAELVGMLAHAAEPELFHEFLRLKRDPAREAALLAPAMETLPVARFALAIDITKASDLALAHRRLDAEWGLHGLERKTSAEWLRWGHDLLAEGGTILAVVAASTLTEHRLADFDKLDAAAKAAVKKDLEQLYHWLAAQHPAFAKRSDQEKMYYAGVVERLYRVFNPI